MTPSPIFQFAIDNPWLAFFLSWPTVILLISFAWCFTTLVANTFNLFLEILSQIFALMLTLVRGYPPKGTFDRLGLTNEQLYEEMKKGGVIKEEDEKPSSR